MLCSPVEEGYLNLNGFSANVMLSLIKTYINNPGVNSTLTCFILLNLDES